MANASAGRAACAVAHAHPYAPLGLRDGLRNAYAAGFEILMEWNVIHPGKEKNTAELSDWPYPYNGAVKNDLRCEQLERQIGIAQM